MVQVFFDKEDYLWKAVKPKGRRAPLHNSSKNNSVYTKYQKIKAGQTNQKTSSEHVLLKITGGAKDTKGANRHFHYITRDNELTLTDSDGRIIPLREAKGELENIFDEDLGRSDSRKSYQMIFSTKGKNKTEDLLKAVHETMTTEFPDNKFYVAVHQDTKNTHAHVVLARQDTKGKRHEINKRKLNKLKKTYSINLTNVGIKSHFLSESEKQRLEIAGRRNKRTERVDRRKGNDVYKVVDFGHAKYKFDENGKDSFYLMLKTRNGVIKTHWSLGLEVSLQGNGVRIGDNIKIKKTNATENISRSNSSFKRSSWHIEKMEQGVSNYPQKFEIIDFGHAKYKFDENGKDSFYIVGKDEYGNQFDLWNKELEGFVKKKNIKAGDVFKVNENGLDKVNEPLVTKNNNIKGSLKI